MCSTCSGDRFVMVRLRSPETTMWMEEHGIKANPASFHEEYAPCPDCHPIDITYFRGTSRPFRSMDAGQTRRALQQ